MAISPVYADDIFTNRPAFSPAETPPRADTSRTLTDMCVTYQDNDMKAGDTVEML